MSVAFTEIFFDGWSYDSFKKRLSTSKFGKAEVKKQPINKNIQGKSSKGKSNKESV